MIVTPVGDTRVYICEDTAECVVDIVGENTVYQIAEFLEAMNYVVRYIAGPSEAAEKLQYYTAGEIINNDDVKIKVKELI